MPTIYNLDDEIDLEVYEFLRECDSDDIKTLITSLIEDGHLPDSVSLDRLAIGASEHEYVDSIDKLRNKWNQLTAEEEQIILNIAKRF
jgi:hypothetical protein